MEPLERRVGTALLGASVVLWAFLVAQFWWVTDDAFISFRYAANLAAGEGLRFNLGPGPPVEGYSNLLWVLIAAIFEWMGIATQHAMPIVSAACGLGLLILVHRVATLHLKQTPIAGAASVAATGLASSTIIWSTSGLETMAFALLLFALFVLVVLEERPPWWSVALVGLLLVLVRTEGLGWVLVVGGIGGVMGRWKDQRETLARAAGVLTLTVLIYAAWRWSWFGGLVSNTAKAKVAFSWDRMGRGLDYVLTNVLEAWVPIVYFLGGIFTIRRHRRLGWAVLAMAAGPHAYAMLVSGDFMCFGRLLVPATPFLGLCMGELIQRLRDHAPHAPLPVAIVAICIIGSGNLNLREQPLLSTSFRTALQFRFNESHEPRSERQQWALQKSNCEQWSVLGRVLGQHLPPGSSLVTGGIGAIGYFSELRIYDLYGLVSPEVLDAPATHGNSMKSMPGHDQKVTPTFFLPYEPDVLWTKAIKGDQNKAWTWLKSLNISPEVRQKYRPQVSQVSLDGLHFNLAMVRKSTLGSAPR